MALPKDLLEKYGVLTDKEILLLYVDRKALERECDGDIDKVILWWEAVHRDSYHSGRLDRARVLRARGMMRRQMRKAHLQNLIRNLGAKRLAKKVVP